jgi:hypothetical protein
VSEPEQARATEAVQLPRGYWPADKARRILDKVLTFRLEEDVSTLTPAERGVVDELVAVGYLLGDLYEQQRHHQALRAREELREVHERLGRPARTGDLLDLYHQFLGPIATTLENELEPFLPVDGFTEGKAFYPWGIERDELDAFLATHPERQPEILGIHTIVRRSTPRHLKRDLLTLRRHPELAALHPGLQSHLGALADDPAREAFYAVPYSVAWPGPLLEASRRLSAAAAAIDAESPDAGAYLRQRARDLLTDDNEAGDAAWIRGDIGRIDGVIGAYEVYDDGLFGAKASFGLSVAIRDEPATDLLRAELAHLQEIEDALPYEGRRRLRSDIPVASVNVLAAFGAAVDVSAEILPNDPTLMRKYGRKILVRRNHLTNPAAFGRVRTRWEAGVLPEHLGDLTAEGIYQQVVWHEIGHYLGPDTDRRGRSLDAALEADAAPIEELKAELVSQFAMTRLLALGLVDEAAVRGVAASVILASLRPVRPLRSQAYSTIWLMVLNYYLDRGYLVYDAGRIGIRQERHEAAVSAMLADVLAIQEEGSKERSTAYIDRWRAWDDRHEAIARALQGAERYRYLDARYGLLEAAGAGEAPMGASSSR